MAKRSSKSAASKGARPPKVRQTKWAHLLPYPDFPLFAHNGQRWAKVIRGRRHYFGSVADGWEAALALYDAQKGDLHAGRTPRPEPEGVTVDEAVNRFLRAKRLKVESGELMPRTWDGYKIICARIKAFFGGKRMVDDLRPEDFENLRAEFARTHGPQALKVDVTATRVVFRYAYDVGLIEQPVKFGPEFKPPSRKTLTKARHAKGPRLFTAAELRQMIGTAGGPLKAMILLGLNGGLGNNDVGLLPFSALDLEGGWIDYPRPKTGNERRIPLWPETISALKDAIEARPDPKHEADAELVFITARGLPWAKGREIKTVDEGKTKKERVAIDSPVSKETRRLLDGLGIKRPGATFYSLRHVFQTIGEESGDQVATRSIMGHAPHSSDMSAVYRERIANERLQRVVNHVRNWLLTADRTPDEKEPEGGWTL